METIKDIIQEMREFADADSQSIGRDVLRRRIQHFADRIEQAVTNCNQLMMREALGKINCIVWDKRRHTKEETEAHRLATEALTQPPRNCDLYATEAEAYRGWERYYNSIDPKDGYLDFEDWLFAETKGEMK